MYNRPSIVCEPYLYTHTTTKLIMPHLVVNTMIYDIKTNDMVLYGLHILQYLNVVYYWNTFINKIINRIKQNNYKFCHRVCCKLFVNCLSIS